MKKLISIIGALLIQSAHAATDEQISISLPFFSPSFFSIQPDLTIKNTVSINTKKPFFCIIVGEPLKNTSITDDKELIATLHTFAEKCILPAQYAPFTPGATPTFIFFNWDDKDNQKKQKVHAEQLTSGIKGLLNRYPEALVILIGYGQGNTLINSATQQLTPNKKSPKQKLIDLVIQLAPRVTAQSTPNTNVIKSTLSFYSKKETPSRSNQKYEKYYPQKHFPLIMNVLLLINNKHPEEEAMLSPFVAKHLLTMCQELSKGCSFFMITEMNKKGIVFHHRFHLSTMREDTHMKLLALPIDTTDEEAIKAALLNIDTKNDLLNKCVCTMKQEEQDHKKSWGNYPDSIRTISQYQQPASKNKKLAKTKIPVSKKQVKT